MNGGLKFVTTECQVSSSPPFLICTNPDASDDFSQGVREGRHLISTNEYALAALKPGDTFIDVGANLGTYSIPVAKKGCRVIAIEALQENYDLLCESVRQNGVHSLTAIHAAAFNRGGIVHLNGSSAWATITNGSGAAVPAVRLDEVLTVQGIASVDLMKIDVEGSEKAVLEGLGEAIDRVKSILIEVNEPACRAAGHTGRELLEMLVGKGFQHLYMFLGHVLVPRRADEFRELYNCDFLALRSPLDSPPEPFGVSTPPTELSVLLALSQAESEFDSPRHYFVEALGSAPLQIANDERIIAAAARLGACRLPRLAGTVDQRAIGIVAPSRASCGVGSYARMLHANLNGYGFRASLVPFDDGLLQESTADYRRLADRQIDDICKSLTGYECINFHFELGTLGGPKHGLPRFMRIVEAARSLILDFHTIVRPRPLRRGRGVELFVSRRFGELKAWQRERRYHECWRTIYAALKRAEASKPVRAVVHTPDDARYLREIVGLHDIVDHPLAYMDPLEAAGVVRDRPQIRKRLGTELSFNPDKTFLIGCFGFLSRHKGVDQAIRVLTGLPSTTKLVIVGQVHPRMRPSGSYADPYIESLVGLVRELDLGGRVFFAGERDDRGFKEAIAAVDLALFPYLEVGQRSSGPIQMAIELGVPIACTPTRCFEALAEYYPDRLHFFDAGNDLRLVRIVDALRRGAYRNRFEHPVRAPNTRTMVADFTRFPTTSGRHAPPRRAENPKAGRRQEVVLPEFGSSAS